MRRAVLLAALLAALPAVGASPLPLAAPTPDLAAPGPADVPTVAQLQRAVLVELGNRSGTNLTREDVDVSIDLDFRKLDFDALGLIFGGGTFEAQGRLKLHADLRALAVGRAAEMARERDLPLPANTVNETYLYADTFRMTLAGEALAAFEREQEARIGALVVGSFPNMTVLSSRFAWGNVDPAVNARGDRQGEAPRLTEPPVTLDVELDVQYLEREKLVDILAELLRPESRREEAAEEAEEAAIDRLKAENAGAFYEQSAFGTLGITQLLTLEMPPGWDLELEMRLPEGFTIEYASPDVLVAGDLQSARTFALAGDADSSVENPVALSLSNRYLVSVALLLTVLLVGGVLRIPVLLVAHWLRPGRRARPRRGPAPGAKPAAAEAAPPPS